jgi:hypothetical protein
MPYLPHQRKRHEPWNKGKLTGLKPPIKLPEIWAIRTRLQIDQRTWDLALFNLALDSKLRSYGPESHHRCGIAWRARPTRSSPHRG